MPPSPPDEARVAGGARERGARSTGARGFVAAVATLGATLATFACTGSNAPHQVDSGAPAPEGGGDDAATDGEAGSPPAHVRLAQWATDAPVVDVCFALQDGSWAGQVPRLLLLVGTSDAGGLDETEAGAVGLGFAQVTPYLVLPPGAYAVRLVAAGATDCTTPVAELPSVALAAGSYTTVAAIDQPAPTQSSSPTKLVAFSDEVIAPAGQIALRFVNASPTLASVAFGTGSLAVTGGSYAPLFTGVLAGQAGMATESDAGVVDANGYLATIPYAGATLSAHLASTATDLAIASNVIIAAGSAVTIVLVGRSGATGNDAVRLLRCADADGATGALSVCDVISD